MEERKANEILNEDLENLEKKIRLIGTADPERYKEFMERLKAIQNSTLGMTESSFEDAKFSIIRQMTSLQFDFDSYMDGTENNSPDSTSVSGKTKIKQYKINLYKSIVSDFKKLDEIDIEHLKQLRQKWNQDRDDEYLEYLPIEKAAVEEAISEAFLDYQIKYAKTNGSLSKELISDYTSFDEYHARIKERLMSIAQKDTCDASTKLEIEEYLKEENLEALLSNKSLWKLFTARDIEYNSQDISKILGREEEKTNPEPNSNLPMVVDEEKKNKKYMYCTIRKKNLFGKEKEKTIKIKVKNSTAYLPEKYKDKVIAVTIPEGTTRVGYEAFLDAYNLEKVYLPSTLKEIGESAFQNCIGLTEIAFPSSLEKIGKHAFSNCENLEHINLHQGIAQIDEYSFENTGIREIDFSKYDSDKEQYTRVGIGAFKGCKNLEKVTLSKKYSYLSADLFRDCSNLRIVKFFEGLKTIGESAFRNCTSLTEMLNLPESVEEIESGCFKGCTNLKKIKLPTFLKRLWPGWIDANTVFESLVLPSQLMNVEILENLNTTMENNVKVPENAQGYLYEKLRLKPGEEISFSDLKLRIADKNAQEVVIEPERVSRLRRGPGNRLRMKTEIKDPPVIVGIDKLDNEDGPTEEEPDDFEL